jgi:hypothetical protein
MSESQDDEELLAALREALGTQGDIPAEFVEAGKRAFAWRNIDAELADLTHDSLTSAGDALSLRAETASIRTLTFTGPHLTIELEVAGDSVLGQVVPGQPAAITVQPASGVVVTLDADDIGRFSVQPIPAGLFRLFCRTAGGIETLTSWVTLQRD